MAHPAMPVQKERLCALLLNLLRNANLTLRGIDRALGEGIGVTNLRLKARVATDEDHHMIYTVIQAKIKYWNQYLEEYEKQYGKSDGHTSIRTQQ